MPRVATTLLFATVCADLAIINAPLNLTMDAARLAPPDWYRASSDAQRVYVGGRVRGYMNGTDPDGVATWQIPAEATAIEGRMELNAQLPMAPSGWRVREALSYDLPYLWPAEYEGTVRRFEDAGSQERAAFLRRTAVSRCVLPAAREFPFTRIADVPDWNMRAFDCGAGATRVYIASAIAAAVDPKDLAWQREALFDTGMRDDEVRLERVPATSGTAGSPEPPSVRILEDRANSVIVEAALRDPGVVVLRDSYDPSWTAVVDGAPADIVRANGIHRAVALPPGRHVIRFSYRPNDVRRGLILTGAAGLFLLWMSKPARRASRSSS